MKIGTWVAGAMGLHHAGVRCGALGRPPVADPS